MTTVETTKNNKWFWLGLGGALLFCLCAVATTVFLFGRIGKRVEQGMKTDPVGAAEAGHAIADYTLPPGYQEEMSMDFLLYTMVFIDDESSDSLSGDQPLIVLAQFRAGANQQQIRQAMEQQGGQRGFSMKIVDTKKMTIRGKEVEVVTLEGSDELGNTMRQVITTFPGKSGNAMLMIMGDPKNWDKEEIDAFIESIH